MLFWLYYMEECSLWERHPEVFRVTYIMGSTFHDSKFLLLSVIYNLVTLFPGKYR